MNKVILIGNLGKDPETKTFDSGNTVVNFPIATTKRWKKDGEAKTRTEWHNIVAWGKLGEIMAKYLKKGSKVMIEGEIQSRSYEDKEGVTKYVTEISANEMEMLDSKGEKTEPDTAGKTEPAPKVTPSPDPDDGLPF